MCISSFSSPSLSSSSSSSSSSSYSSSSSSLRGWGGGGRDGGLNCIASEVHFAVVMFESCEVAQVGVKKKEALTRGVPKRKSLGVMIGALA